ncbi:MAG TPA: hypothetical protein PJ988_15415 [Anaerolinea sp.]|nr:hypothetical protein [Anaerolinea sp.]
MIRGWLAGLSSGPLYRDFRFQLRLVVVVAALFIFLFPSLVGMNLFYIDLFSGHPELQGYPELPAAVESFFGLLNDAAVRQVVLGTIFLIGLVFILGASHMESRLAPILDALGLLMVMQSLFFLLVATDRCIPGVGCNREFFFTAIGLAGVLIPHRSRRFAGWFSLPYISILIYQSFLWLLTLARTPRVTLTWESTYAILLVFVTMLLPTLLALWGFTGPHE